MQNKKPLIGINPYYFQYANHYWNGTMEKYFKAIWLAGGIPFTLNYPQGVGTAEEIAEKIDGLLMVGGPDIPIETYGGKHSELLDEDVMNPKREEFDRAIFFAVKQMKKPILSICAGIQHINVIYGGSLFEDIQTQLKGCINHGEFNGAIVEHTVQLSSGSAIAKIMGTDSPLVDSTHHQGIRKLGQGLNAMGHSEDGLIEAIEDAENPQAFLAVQWHPELGLHKPEQLNLFKWLVNTGATFV